MAVFKVGDRVIFTSSVGIEGLFKVPGIVVSRHSSGGHNVYNVQILSRLNLLSKLPGNIRLVGNVLTDVLGDWIELLD
ncbi:MAG: hypothetical protein V1767_04430 [Chloroflexota bacterium]